MTEKSEPTSHSATIRCSKERRGAENSKKPLTVLAAHQRGLCGHEQLERNHPDSGGTLNSPGFFPIIIVDWGKWNWRRLGFSGAACLRLDLGFYHKPGRVAGEGFDHSQPVKGTIIIFSPVTFFLVKTCLPTGRK